MFNQAKAFEHPLNERIRTFLRLEYLFEKMDYYLFKTEEWATRAVVSTLLEMLSITKTDLKAEMAGELARYITLLEHLEQQSGVDPSALQRILEDLKAAADSIEHLDAQFASKLWSNEFLKTVLRRSSIPAGTCDFDLPYYGYWLRQAHTNRQKQIDIWIQDLLPIRDAIALLLSLIRGSCDPKEVIATTGLYQGILDVQVPIQMVRVQIDPSMPLFPEISGHKHRFNIRFMEVPDDGQPNQSERDVTFLLTCCIF